MTKTELIGDVIFWGGCTGTLVAGVWWHLLSKKIQPKQISGRQALVIIGVCMVPTTILPLWFLPGHFWLKLGGTVFAVIVGTLRFIFTSQAEEALHTVCIQCGKKFWKQEQKPFSNCPACGGVIQEVIIDKW